jgi:hypothetical protein
MAYDVLGHAPYVIFVIAYVGELMSIFFCQLSVRKELGNRQVVGWLLGYAYQKE